MIPSLTGPQTYRLIQYVSRILAWSYGRRGLVEAAARFNALKGALGMGRKSECPSVAKFPVLR